ncbi:Vegetative incompatibility protein HET-E-1 [Beauveria bassiana]|nr:Vegetative incompatibility protein HET-E-1 [Beauveria bassiana]
MNDQGRRLGSCKLYRIVWIAVIVPEITAATAMLDEEHGPPKDFQQNESDENAYIWGRIGNHNILIAFLPAGKTGTNSAATTVARCRASLPHLNVAVLVGIAGAIPKTTVLANKLKRDIRLGDVVVGYPCGNTPGVVQYDLGKSKQGQEWERTGSLNNPPDRLLSVVQLLRSKRDKISAQMKTYIDKMIEENPSYEEEFEHQGVAHDRLFKANYVHRTKSTDCSSCDASQEIPRPKRKSTHPAVHYGLILSGNALKANAIERDTIAKAISEDGLCFEMEAAGIVSQLPCLVIRGISDYADSHKNDLWQSYAAATAAAYAKIVIRNVGPQVQLEEVQCTEVALREQSTAAELDVLSRLPISDEARYDSLEEGKSPLCLPRTREDVLNQLSDWLEKEGSRTLWLNGMVGTGKSTISRSFATNLEERSQLGASFFFKRDDMKRGRVKMFSSTIAADLARRFATARASIVDTLRRYNGVAHKQAQKQFQLLVLDPLSKVQLDKNIAIVIDAVDECDESDLECFFALVSTFQRAELPRVKLFFTSRPDLAVLREFDTRTDDCATIALQRVPDFTIKNDIRIFLEHGLRKVRNKYNHVVDECEQLGPDWPSLEDREKLLKMSNHLFIFAATICRLLEKCSKSSPDLHLKDLLELKTTTDHAFEPTYRPVLDRQIPNDTDISENEKEDLICEYKKVLGAICVLRSPVSVPALARLLGLDVKNIERRLRSLQSVIEVIRPEGSKSKEDTRIRLLHSSFRDFMLSKEVRKISRIWVDRQDAHRVMMECCLATLSRPKSGLRFNICGLASPGTSRWTNDESKKVLNFLEDAYRFAAARWNSLDQAPLQIYTQLLFAPWNSIVRKTFEHRYNTWVLKKPDVDADWGIDFMDIAVKPLPDQGILKLLFSPNERVLAAMSRDAVWFLSSLGEQFLWIPIDNPVGNGESPVAVVFSSDSNLFALRNGIDEIEIWNIENGSDHFKKKIRSFKAEYDVDYFHRPRSFTHNNTCLLIASHHSADFWSIESGQRVGSIGFPHAAHQVAVSPDCSLLAGHFDDGLIYWNIESRQRIHTAILPTEKKARSYDLVLSSNMAAWTITTQSTGSQEVYSTASAGPLAFLQKENNAYTISKDYLIIEYEYEIRIWKHEDQNPQVIKKTSPGPVMTIAYGGTQLASSKTDGIAPGVIFLYRLPKYQPRTVDVSPCLTDSSEFDDGLPDYFQNSPNGTLLASIDPKWARIMSARPGPPSLVENRCLAEIITFSPTGDYFTTSTKTEISLWGRTGTRNSSLRKHYHADKGYDILSANFWSDTCLMVVVAEPWNKPLFVVLEVPSFKKLGRYELPRLVHEAVFSPNRSILAVIDKYGVDFWDFPEDILLLSIPARATAVRISPDSTLALLIGKRFNQFWDIRRRMCLHSETRHPFSGATFDRIQPVILTNSGKIEYYIASGAAQAPGHDELRLEQASLPDDSDWESGGSPAATPEERLTMKFRRIGWGISSNGRWITWNGQNWMRLPTQYCAYCSAIDGNHVLIVNDANIEVRFEFADVPWLEELSNNVDVEMTDYYQECNPKGLGIIQ